MQSPFELVVSIYFRFEKYETFNFKDPIPLLFYRRFEYFDFSFFFLNDKEEYVTQFDCQTLT